MKFENRDYGLSPYTGLTREHWIQAGKELLEGIFRHVGDMDAPVIVARKEKKVTYPHLDAPENIRQAEYKAEMFEGLTRSFLIASVLIHLEPELTICGILLAGYYRLHRWTSISIYTERTGAVMKALSISDMPGFLSLAVWICSREY